MERPAGGFVVAIILTEKGPSGSPIRTELRDQKSYGAAVQRMAKENKQHWWSSLVVPNQDLTGPEHEVPIAFVGAFFGCSVGWDGLRWRCDKWSSKDQEFACEYINIDTLQRRRPQASC